MTRQSKKQNEQDIRELLKAFDEVQIPRTPYILEHMVVGNEDTTEQQYYHCVLELQIAYDNLRTAKASARLKEIEIEEIDQSNEKGELQAEIKKIELEQLNRARLGAMREFEALYIIWKRFPVKFTREQMDSAQPLYWERRLSRQASQDIRAYGRIGVGNQEALRQIGCDPNTLEIGKVTERYLEQGNIKILIAVPTKNKAESGLPNLQDVTLPENCMCKIFNISGHTVEENYTIAVEQALIDGANYLVTIEDDVYPFQDAIVRLVDLAKKNPSTAIGAWYPKRSKPRQGVHIVLADTGREFLQDDGETYEVYTLAMGCSIYPVSMFLNIPKPWFITTSNLTQDSYFSQLAREHGYKLLVDTSIKCKHIDRDTKEVYG